MGTYDLTGIAKSFDTFLQSKNTRDERKSKDLDKLRFEETKTRGSQKKLHRSEDW
jgi:hypothetical protein